VRKRLPWLAVNLVTALLSASVVSLFQGSIEAAAILAVFMPIVAGLGGNAATQSLTVMIRGLTIGEVTSRDLPRAVLKEGSVTLMIGLALGTVMSVVAWIWDANPYLGLTLGLAMVANMMVAGVAGAVVPLALRAVGIDPAAASGVIITTFTDCCGFFSFLGLATLLIHHIAV
jgi:magnesium transporter